NYRLNHDKVLIPPKSRCSKEELSKWGGSPPEKSFWRTLIPYSSLIYSPNGKLLAVINNGGHNEGRMMWLWDLVKGKMLDLEIPPGVGLSIDADRDRKGRTRGVDANSLVFAPDNKMLVLERGWGNIDFWNAETGKYLRHLEGEHRSGQIVFSSDGQN